MEQFFLRILSRLDKLEAFIRRYTAILICILLMFVMNITDSFYRQNNEINDNLHSIERTLDNIKDAIRWTSLN